MNEKNWRIYLRDRKGNVGGGGCLFYFAQAVERCIEWDGQQHNRDSGVEHWIQPDGTEPALKTGAGAIQWRTWHQDADLDFSPHRTLSVLLTKKAAQDNADYCNRATGHPATYWIQPELIEQPMVEVPVENVPFTYYRVAETFGSPPGTIHHAFDSLDEAGCKRVVGALREANPRGCYWVSAVQGVTVKPVEAKPDPTWAIHFEKSANQSPDVHGGWQNLANAGTRAGRIAIENLGQWVRVVEETPKPYERRWTFEGVFSWWSTGKHASMFTEGERYAWMPPQNATDALKFATSLVACDPMMADATIDSIYAGQK